MPLPPLSLYIHIPWCVKKCPYCDFNSHAVHNSIPEAEYLAALIADLQQDLPFAQGRKLQSIFFGGGTPSLFSPQGLGGLLQNISDLIPFSANIEITLEANPGTIEHYNFSDYKSAGINRISLGAQSFNDHKLQALGRIHKAHETLTAIEKLHNINFQSFNIDLMHGLPQQTLVEAMQDLNTALSCNPPHLSWYQLTLEPNTVFYKYPPKLPDDEIAWQIQAAGEELLHAAGFAHYEVSAFAKPGAQCKHNLNYWEFGDYLGIGAGAHGKITDLDTHTVTRSWKTRLPKDYLNSEQNFQAGKTTLTTEQLVFEYMLNRLRLFDKLNLEDFTQRTGLPINHIAAILNAAQNKELISLQNNYVQITTLGKRFLNDLMQMFL